jgi:hypothetical protein
LFECFKRDLSTHFELTQGDPSWILGIHIQRDLQLGSTKLSQQCYITDLLKKLGLQEMKSAPTPDSVAEHLEENTSEPQLDENDKFLLQQITGALIYLATCTRPDISNAVRSVAACIKSPTQKHLQAAKRILRYIKGTADWSLTYSRDRSEPTIQAFVAASWAEDRSNRRSTTDFLFLLSHEPISWSSKQQPTVSLSSCEAEYKALAAATQEAVHLLQVISSAQLKLGSYTIQVFEDNMGAIQLASNATTNTKSKHMDIKLHFVREILKQGSICIHHCPTDKNIADLLTKALTNIKFNKMALQVLGINRHNFVVVPSSSSTFEGGVSTNPMTPKPRTSPDDSAVSEHRDAGPTESSRSQF